jgi:hypothetical protein
VVEVPDDEPVAECEERSTRFTTGRPVREKV